MLSDCLSTTLDTPVIRSLNSTDDNYVEEKDGKKVEQGVFRPGSLDVDVLVLSEGWPSWAFGLRGLGFKSISIKLYNVGLNSTLELKNTFITDVIRTETIDEWFKQSLCPTQMVFIQGSHPFFRQVMEEAKDLLDDCPLAYICSDMNFHCSECIRISHEDVGGVTTGSWSVYTQFLPGVELPVTKVPRSLGHLLNSVEKASNKRSLSKHQGPCYEVQDRIPAGVKVCKVRTKSVFAKNQLIERFITDKEMMNVYDIEADVQEQLLFHTSTNEFELTHSYIHQPPGKVIRTFALALTEALTSSSISSSVELMDDSNHTLMLSNLTEDVHSRNHIDISLDDVSVLLGEDELADNGSQQLAARPDDVEAEASDWDIRSAIDFIPPDGITPLICKGI